MQTARYFNQTVNIHTLERSEWNKLYLASKQGKLTCIHCKAPLRMALSIHKKPSFIHPDPVNEACYTETSSTMTVQKARTQPREFSGFRLPTNSQIEKEPTNETDWKEPEPLVVRHRFQEPKRSDRPDDSYRRTLEDASLSFNDDQWRSIKKTDGPLLILAGAGSGKTRVITARAAYMITELDIPINRIALVTFTSKAAQEMKERMLLYPGITREIGEKILIRTFHSLFLQMLKHHQSEQWHHSRLIQSPHYLVKQIGMTLGLDENEFAYDSAVTQISYWKNHMIPPEQVQAKTAFEEKVKTIYQEYEQQKQFQHYYDFDDILLGCLELLKENSALLEKYQERFSYLSVDEFQDINLLQFEIVRLLSQKNNNLCVVGDDDQSIYAFRGSDPSFIQSFQSYYPSATVVTLEDNYRSTHEIIGTANTVIQKNQQRLSKTLRAQVTKMDNTPTIFYPYNEEEEASIIVEEIASTLATGQSIEQIAVLFRTSAGVRALTERLIDADIPFQLDQTAGTFYDKPIVQKALAFLRLSLYEDHDEAAPYALQALFLKQDKQQELIAIKQKRACTLLEAFPFLTGTQPFQKKKLQQLPELCRKLTTLTPIQALESIEQDIGFKDTLKKQAQEGNQLDKGSDSFRQLKALARQHDTVASFLHYIDCMTVKIKEHKYRPHSSGVQLLTIHRAKGLEFEHVYIIGCVDRSLPHDYALDALKEGDEAPLQEERRLLYVAMTRAKSRLYLSSPLYYFENRSFASRFLLPVLKNRSRS
ncbi:ATP-dependent helicase [Shouchella miscanthi]|uniref:ATP-dependent helicase n=1 Tax=Shouchella miscanthi TaxID=2598861 RepID=UPI0011AB1CD9|nr:ATP-dependent helicase [Shouchella miscanthi]